MDVKSLIPLLLLILSPFSQVAAGNGYASTCNSIRPYFGSNGWVILANCRKPSGIYNVGVSIKLDSYFANAGGHLKGRLW